MNYVHTRKQPLVEAQYKAEAILHRIHNRVFYENYPAPMQFTVALEAFDFKDRFISSEDMNLLSVWYNRGTTLQIGNKTLTFGNPRPQWVYTFVNSLPKPYISRGATTPQKAYDFGKKLIAACTKASRIPSKNLEEGYKAIMKACLANNIYAHSPNEKTWYETKAELDAEREIKNLYSMVPDVETSLTDIELQFYARVFDIQMPKWFLRASHIKTNNGYAVCPFTDQTAYVTLATNQKDASGDFKPGYAGNDFENNVPTTMLRDATPQLISNQAADRAKLAEQVMFYLNLPIEEQILFMTAEYGYCFTCKEYYALRDGCTCRENLPIEDDEYPSIMATREFALSTALYD